MWSGRRDSNSRRSPWQGDALPLSHSRINVFSTFMHYTNFFAVCQEFRLKLFVFIVVFIVVLIIFLIVVLILVIVLLILVVILILIVVLVIVFHN